LFDEANQIKQNMFKSYEMQQKKKEYQAKIESAVNIKKGQLASSVLDSKSPLETFIKMRRAAQENKFPLSPGLMNYNPSDQDIENNTLDPRVTTELEYLVDKSLTPEQRIARSKKTTGQGDEYSLNPIYGKDKSGKRVAFQTNKAGGVKQIEIPDGVVLSAGVTKMDLGDSVVILDKDGKPVLTYLKNAPPQGTPEFKAKVAKAVQDAKGEISATDKKIEGQKKVSSHIKRMAGLWKQLDARGAAISTEKGFFDNLGNRIASSDAGQFVQGAVGSKTQSIREQIQTLKPALILAIKNANPSIGAKGMDTPAELNFYLSAIGNEKRDIESNMAALIILDESMGLKSNIKVTPGIKDAMKELKSSPELRAAQMEDLKATMPEEKTEEETLRGKMKRKQ